MPIKNCEQVQAISGALSFSRLLLPGTGSDPKLTPGRLNEYAFEHQRW
jgi:hypothetical protein